MAPLTFAAVADGIVADRDWNGSFETVDATGTSITNRWFQIVNIGEERGVFEFDLTSVAPGTTLNSAKIGFYISSYTMPPDPQLVFRAYAGDGSVTAADGTRVAAAAGTASVSDLGYQEFSLDASLLAPLLGGWAGIRLENTALDAPWILLASRDDAVLPDPKLLLELPETGTLGLALADAAVSEAAGANATTATLTRTGDLSQPLTVTLASSDPSEATVPATVTFAANQYTKTFTVSAVDDTLLDGPQTTLITAAATGYVSASASVEVTDYEALTLSLSPTSISENGGTATGTVTRNNTDRAAPLTVYLASADLSEATVPATVTIAANAASATFTVTAVDDALRDGTQTVTVTASAAGYVGGTRTLSVTDYETLTVTISPTSISENGGTATGTVTRSNTDTAAALTVTLSSNDTSEATVSGNVTIPANQASANFSLTAIDDTLLDGTQTVTVTAFATGYVSGTRTLSVTDYETVSVSLVPLWISENGGAATGTVTRNNTNISAALTVSLSSSDASEATVPASVTIPANQTSVTFTVTAVDDALADGDQPVTVAASATGYVGASAAVSVTDDDGPYLSVTVAPASFSENGGTATGTVTRINADLGADLVITLNSTDPSEAAVPATVTIPATQSAATFTISAVDDTLRDGTQTAFVVASATGFSTGLASVSVTDHETLTVTVTSGTISENGGTTTGTVTRSNTDRSAALTVSLSSSDTTEASVPATVTIAINQASATFTVTGVNDTLLDGTQTATITASATGYVNGSADVSVTDYETLTVTISPASISENGGSATGTVTRNNTDLGASLTVSLASSDTSEATVPATVTIAADATSATFPIAAVDDTLKDGTQTATVTASAAGYVNGTRTVNVTDYETLTVSISPDSMSENGGTATGTVTRNNTDIGAALTVSLSSGDTTEATVPASVTILANSAAQTFTITAVDDLWMDGTQTVAITASASGYVAGTDTIDVTDGDVPMLFLSIAAAAVSEGAGAGATTATVTRNSGTTDALEVLLSSSDSSEATVNNAVIIPAGQPSVQVNIDAVNDVIVDGLQTVVITAAAAGHLSATDTVDVRDDEPVLLVDGDATTADTDPLVGSTWDKAYSQLQSALTAARTRNADADALNNVSEIWVANGTYVAGPARYAGFGMVTNVAVYGGFQGISAAVRETIRNDRFRDAHGKLVYQTVLSGDIGRNDAPNLTLSQLLSHSTRLDNAYRVVSASNATNVLLDGLTITGGTAIDITQTLSTYYDGGGILATNSLGTNPVVTINEVLITGNAAGGAGGGIAGSGATITITNSAIVGNTAGSGGGIGDGIYNISSLTVSNSLVAGNVASVGGAISTQARPTITQSTIVNNVAHYGGGFGKLNGDVNWTGDVLAKNTIIARNTALTYPDLAANFRAGSDYNLIGIWQRTSAIGVHSVAGTLALPVDPRISDWTLRSSGGWGYYLLPGSLALDAGDNAAAVTPGGATLVTDLYGSPRIAGAAVDIGAIEGPAATTPAVTYNVQTLDKTVTVDGTLTFGEALQAANTNQAAGDAVAGSFADRDVIQFAPGVTGVAHLAGTPMFLSGRLAMVGPGSSLLSIDAGGLSQVAEILPGADVELSDLTLTGGTDDVGSVSHYPPYPNGGAIANYGDLGLYRDTISSSVSVGGGGAVYNVAVLGVGDSMIVDNTAGSGAAVYNYGLLTVARSTFTNNGAGGYGGAIYHSQGDAVISESTFSGNTATFGGGIYQGFDTLEISDSTLTGNVALEGAGLYIREAMTTVVGTTFRDNHARPRSGFESSGGGIEIEAGTLKIVQSSFLGNSADNGGGFYNSYAHGFADVFITQSRFVGNTATAKGGGLYLGYYTYAYIKDSTIAGNVAASGGGIGPADDMQIHNSIVAKNTAADAYDDVASFYWRPSWNNLFGVGYDDTATLNGQNGHIVGTPAAPVDPLFKRNPDDGGDGWGDNPVTSGVDESVNDDFGDLSLLLASPAIDAGDQTRLPADEFDLDADGNTAEPLPLDFAGDARVQHGQLDMGLYEALIPALAMTVDVASVSENAGSEAVTGTVSRNTSTLEELVISLSSSDTSEATVPGTVTIPTSQASVTFWVAVADDTLLDGTQPVTITATAAGHLSGSVTVEVADWETLSVNISPASISENGGTATGTVTRNNTDIGLPLTVDLASSDTTEAVVPATVTIPASQASTTFTVTAVDDVLLDGTQTVTITASAGGYAAGAAQILVTDVENPPAVIAAIPDATVAEDAANTVIDLRPVFDDPDQGLGDALTYTATVTMPIDSLVAQVSQTSYTTLHQDLLYTHSGDNRGLAGPEHDLARENIYAYFAGLGLQTTLEPFVYNSQTCYNVVAVRPGVTRPNDVYLVGAHYDSVNNPGADDNASGTAAVLELARVLSQYQFDATLVFVGFDREEQGLKGAYAYTASHDPAQIKGMLSLDMIAYNPAGAAQNQVRLYDSNGSGTIKNALASAFASYSGGLTTVNAGTIDASDHHPFELAGVDAALVVESGVWTNPHYHQATDAVETAGYIDYEYATKITRGVVGYLATAAGLIGTSNLLTATVSGRDLILDYAADAYGIADVLVRATDAAGQFAEDTFRVTVTPVNDAPVLDNAGTMALTAIDEDDVTNPGRLVRDILASAGGDRITDADRGALEGIAVIAVDDAHGTWQYTLNGGRTWLAFGTVTATDARLLGSDAGTRVRFVPATDWHETVDPGLTFRAWDHTRGGNGGTADASVGGAANAFSAVTETALIVVQAVNDPPTIDMTIVETPSATGGNGEAATLPVSRAWVHEWMPFFVEIWVSTPDTNALGVAKATVDLQYNTSYLTAQEIQYGPAFTQELTGTIDDSLGRVSAIGGATALTNVGDDAYVLLARVRFASTDSDQVPVDEAGRNIGPYNVQLALANGQTQLVGGGAPVPVLTAPPATALWAVMYDIDDNNLVDFGDLSYFAAAFGRTVGLPSTEPPYAWWADFDKSGLVDFGDLSFLAANFGKGRAAGQPIGFPPSFPNGWASASEPRQGDTLGSDGAVVELAEPRLPCDVNGDGRVAPLDALILVNALNLQAAWGLPSKVPPGGAQPPYLDSTGDGHLTPADVLQVISYLNGIESSVAGEGEPWGSHAADGPRAALSVLLGASWSHEASEPRLLPGQPQGDSQRTLAAEDRDLPLDAERSEEARRRWLGKPAARGSGGGRALAWEDELDFASLDLEEVVSHIASAVAAGWKA